MTDRHLSTIRRVPFVGMGQHFLSIFRNGAIGLGGYIVRLILMSGIDRTDLSADNQAWGLAVLAVRQQSDDLIQTSGWYCVALTIP